MGKKCIVRRQVNNKILNVKFKKINGLKPSSDICSGLWESNRQTKENLTAYEKTEKGGDIGLKITIVTKVL